VAYVIAYCHMSEAERTFWWDRIRWGMMNGTLPALRWFLDEAWDELDT
jgi:hypothetical protein